MAFLFAGRTETYNPVDLGLLSKALNATTNSNGFGTDGFNQLTLEFDVVKLTAGTITITFGLQQREQGSTVWKTQQIVSSSAAGVDSLSDHTYSYAITAGAATYGFAIDIPINTGEMRVQSLTASGAGATDLVSVAARIGVV